MFKDLAPPFGAVRCPSNGAQGLQGLAILQPPEATKACGSSKEADLRPQIKFNINQQSPLSSLQIWDLKSACWSIVQSPRKRKGTRFNTKPGYLVWFHKIHRFEPTQHPFTSRRKNTVAYPEDHENHQPNDHVVHALSLFAHLKGKKNTPKWLAKKLRFRWIWYRYVNISIW